MGSLFGISELRQTAAAALRAIGYVPPESGRVRAVPDTRTIRYYTTLGLIDRPAEMRGRTAFYSRRHVLQIVAIKKLQSDDLTLSHIQSTLGGMPDRQLQKLVDLPDTFWREATTRESDDEVSPDDTDFWTTLPAPLPNDSASASVDSPVQTRVHVSLATGVELVVTADCEKAATLDHSRILRAAKALIDELTRQQFLTHSEE